MYQRVERMSRERQAAFREQASALRMARMAGQSWTAPHGHAPRRLGASLQALTREWSRWMPRPANH